eukprot:1151365-Pelagomonas_calceolata.AAC.14
MVQGVFGDCKWTSIRVALLVWARPIIILWCCLGWRRVVMEMLGAALDKMLKMIGSGKIG